MTRRGLVLEGGAMRGFFTCGVIDLMMEHGLQPDGIVGVSAGAAFGCNYKSRQPGRALRYNQRFARDARYCSWHSWLTTGDLFNARFAYHDVPNIYDPFDNATFEANPMDFHVVCTDVDTGRAVYHQLTRGGDEAYDWIRASASMPVASRIVELGGHRLLDGGVADSIPLKYMEEQGYGRNVVVLTQPAGYQKPHNRLMPLMRLALRRHPQMVEAMDKRHLMYNAQVAYVAEAERQGRCLVVRPPQPLPIGHVSHDPRQMQRVYDIGHATALAMLPQLAEWLG